MIIATQAQIGVDTMMNMEQIKGLRLQLAGLLLQSCGHLISNEKVIAKGSALRLKGYIRARLGKALHMGRQRMHQWHSRRTTSALRIANVNVIERRSHA